LHNFNGVKSTKCLYRR